MDCFHGVWLVVEGNVDCPSLLLRDRFTACSTTWTRCSSIYSNNPVSCRTHLLLFISTQVKLKFILAIKINKLISIKFNSHEAYIWWYVRTLFYHIIEIISNFVCPYYCVQWENKNYNNPEAIILRQFYLMFKLLQYMLHWVSICVAFQNNGRI